MRSRSLNESFKTAEVELRACTRRLSGVENGDWLRVFEVPVPDFDGADAESRVAGNGDRHLEDSEPVPVPSSYPFFVHPFRSQMTGIPQTSISSFNSMGFGSMPLPGEVAEIRVITPPMLVMACNHEVYALVLSRKKTKNLKIAPASRAS
jgi:hypothetical protein